MHDDPDEVKVCAYRCALVFYPDLLAWSLSAVERTETETSLMSFGKPKRKRHIPAYVAFIASLQVYL
jgi:hypothetical protein